MVANVAQDDNLEKRLRIADEGASLMLATLRENGPQLHVAEAAGSSADVSVRSAEFQLLAVSTCLSHHCGRR